MVNTNRGSEQLIKTLISSFLLAASLVSFGPIRQEDGFTATMDGAPYSFWYADSALEDTDHGISNATDSDSTVWVKSVAQSTNPIASGGIGFNIRWSPSASITQSPETAYVKVVVSGRLSGPQGSSAQIFDALSSGSLLSTFSSAGEFTTLSTQYFETEMTPSALENGTTVGSIGVILDILTASGGARAEEKVEVVQVSNSPLQAANFKFDNNEIWAAVDKIHRTISL